MRIWGVWASTAIVLLLTGCSTVGSTSNVVTNVRQGYSQKVEDIIGVIKVDGIPKAFSAPLVADIQAQLEQRGVKADIRPVSDLDLNPLRNSDVLPFKYLIVCVPTKLFSTNHVLQSVTMNCTLSETKTRLVVMKADATANKGWGFGFGENEADHVTKKLLKTMEENGLISAQPAVQGDRPQKAGTSI
jgi:hypothetical protein